MKRQMIKEFYPGSTHELSPPEALSLLPVNSLATVMLLAHSRLCSLGLSLWVRTLKCFRLPFAPVSSHYSQLSSFALFSLPVSKIILSLARPGRTFLCSLENPSIRALQQACKVQRRLGERGWGRSAGLAEPEEESNHSQAALGDGPWKHTVHMDGQ